MEIKEKINELERQLNELKALLKEEAKDDRPITKRVKTLEDALDILGEEHPFVQQWWDYTSTDDNADIPTKDSADLIAYFKLRIITAALNEGWVPEFTEGESRYYPWYRMYTQKEYDDLPDNVEQELVLFGGDAYRGAYCGLVWADSGFAWSYSATSLSSRLAYKTAELAKYSARQFADIWADFYLIRK